MPFSINIPSARRILLCSFNSDFILEIGRGLTDSVDTTILIDVGEQVFFADSEEEGRAWIEKRRQHMAAAAA